MDGVKKFHQIISFDTMLGVFNFSVILSVSVKKRNTMVWLNAFKQ